MDRISAFGFTLDAYGHRVFANQNLAAGTNGTDVDATWQTGIQEEIAGLIETTNIALDVTNNGQATKAVRRLSRANYTAVTVTTALTADQAGKVTSTAATANTIITLPAANACGPGVPVCFRIKRPASDVATYSVNVLPAGTDLFQDGALNAAAVALGANPCLLMRGETLELWSDGVSNWYGFYSSKIRAGSFGAGGTYGTTGTTMWRVPPFITEVEAEVWGGGGGGGATVGAPSAASGGGGGGYTRGVYPVTPGTLIAVTAGTPGAGAAAGTSNSGITGGTSSFGTLLSALGGTYGVGAGTGGYQGTYVGQGGTVSGGTILNLTGNPGAIGASINSVGLGGCGGSNYAASGGPPTAGGGLPGSPVAGGGSGGANGGGGGGGGYGFVLVRL